MLNHRFRQIRRLIFMMLVMLGSIISLLLSNPTQLHAWDSMNLTQSVETHTSPVLLGMYTSKYLGNQDVIDSELNQINTWTGKRHSLAGIFIDIEDSNPEYNIPTILESLRRNGYTGFINLKSTHTARQIAIGDVDTAVQRFARAYEKWSSQGEGRMAFIAPFPEMNIPGEKYNSDAANFKLIYERIQTIFGDAGVVKNSVRWVFAPNGWTANSTNTFKNYYPGDDKVDVVAFSAYNWGYCHNASWKNWQLAKEVFEPYIQQMQTMAPNKPIFIAQTATTSTMQTGKEAKDVKDQWLRDTYTYLANHGVSAVLYFNIDKECDWAFYSASDQRYSLGYKDGVQNSAFGYIAPAELARNFEF
ncbi:MAG: glycosyl hydrolase [Aulosira sp. DedQUE10]|nr:glycosyl hydrolase [Aulosira sp. DedQUE10]